jgi:hypothetical protein
MNLYPMTDIPHVLNALPLVLPLLARQVDRLQRTARSRAAAWASTALLVLLAGLFCAPAVGRLAALRAARPPDPPRFARATGIWEPGTHFAEAAALVRALEAYPGRDLLVLPNGQMTNFLAGRRSPVDRYEFVLYLLNFDLIADADARRLLDEHEAIARLEATRAIVVRRRNRGLERLRTALPTLMRHVDTHYRTVATVGRFDILDAPPR